MDLAVDPVALLMGEHERALALFHEFDKGLVALEHHDADGRSRLLGQARAVLDFLNTGLEVHIRKEEEALFPRLKAVLPVDDRLVEELIAEHDQIRLKREQVRAVLDEMLAGHDHDVRGQRAAFTAALTAAEGGEERPAPLHALRSAWRAAFQTLRVHFQNEDEIGFPLARDRISAKELAAAAREMQEIEMEQTSMGEPVQRLGVLQELSALLNSSEVARAGRSARTLFKDGSLRLVLVALGATGVLQEHHAPGPLTIQALSGSVTVEAGDQSFPLHLGDLLVLPAGAPHAVQAHEPSGLLLTMVVHA